MSFKFCHFETIWKISLGHCSPLTPTPQFRHLSGGISASRISSFLLTVFLEITFRICGPPPNLYISKDSAKMELWKCVHFRNFSSLRGSFGWSDYRLLTAQPLIPLRWVFGAISVATCIFYKTLPLLPSPVPRCRQISRIFWFELFPQVLLLPVGLQPLVFHTPFISEMKLWFKASQRLPAS